LIDFRRLNLKNILKEFYSFPTKKLSRVEFNVHAFVRLWKSGENVVLGCEFWFGEHGSNQRRVISIW
jgi:hypothetical protein